jgi:hypothetical protein
LVVVAEHADEEPEAIDRPDRIVLVRTVLLGVRAAQGEMRRRLARRLGWDGLVSAARFSRGRAGDAQPSVTMRTLRISQPLCRGLVSLMTASSDVE